jgi:hypothetical protein
MKTHSIFTPLLVAGVLTLLTGCSTPSTRIQANPEAFARLSPQHQELVRAGQVALGFDEDAVKLALGDPDRRSRRIDADGETAIWHYATYQYEGRILFSGYYHTRRPWWGWGVAYPYYLDYPAREVRDRFRVEFRNGRVIAISEDVIN